VTAGDWIALAVIVLVALNGLRLGFVGGVFSLVGVAAGAYLGAKLAPQVLSGSDSPYTPLIALGGAVLLGTLLQSVASMGGQAIRSALFTLPPLRALDSVGGLVLGAAAGVAIVWVAGAVALHIPGQTELREDVQSSRILSEINKRVPPSRLLDAISRVDPFAAIRGPQARVDRNDGDFRDARVVYFDARDDIAVLRVDGLQARPLDVADPSEGVAVAILGYPDNGPFTATPGRIGQTGVVLTNDAYGRGPLRRVVTTLRGRVRHGNSGGPAVDGAGNVRTTIFAARLGSDSGYGVPTGAVRDAVARTGAGKVSTGPCVR
jgi:uncharacterized membrane protein required for colicin V production